MNKLLGLIFFWSLSIAILLGILIVLGQFLGLVLHSDEWILTSKLYFAKTAYIASGIAGIAAFIVSYLPGKKQ